MTERPTPFQVEVQKMARQLMVIIGILALGVAGILLFVLHQSLIIIIWHLTRLAWRLPPSRKTFRLF
jgi:hypothetical protein